MCFTVSKHCCITVSAVVRFIFRGWGRRWVKANRKYFYLRDWSVHVFSMFCIVFSVSIYVICLLQYEVFGSHWTTCRAQLWALWTEAPGLNLSISPLMCIIKHKIFLWYAISLYWYIMHLYLLYIRGVTISQTEPKDRDTPPTIRIAELSWRTAVLSRPLLPIAEVNGTYL